MSKLLIHSGRVVDPANDIDREIDLLIEDGRVVELGALGQLKNRVDTSINATGLIVTPGLIDMHVHLREPGEEGDETVESGTAAAVAGGFTSVVCMPNTDPCIDNETTVDFVYRQAAIANAANVFVLGAITKSRQGEELAEMAQMVRAGAVGFTDDGCGVRSSAVMLKALQYAKMFDRAILQHCEDPDLAEGGCMHAGLVSTILGLSGMPSMAEELMVQRDIILAESVDARYHVMHISTAGAVELVRAAKRRGLPVSTEVCSHHLVLTDEECRSFDPVYKMHPPLRPRKDVEAMLEGLVDGTIDCLVTDHAPHSESDKQLEFISAPPGVIGLESALAIFIKALIEPGILDWPAMIAKMTVNPSRILGLNKGTLAVGADADVTVINPAFRWTIDSASFRSRGRNCPFHGWQVTGKAVATVVGGQIKYSNGELVAPGGAGIATR